MTSHPAPGEIAPPHGLAPSSRPPTAGSELQAAAASLHRLPASGAPAAGAPRPKWAPQRGTQANHASAPPPP
eukprot:5534891-Pleurochrysis_carterae.AAC.1